MSSFIEDYNVTTGPMGIGSSVVKVHTGRDLTAGEITMCRQIFGTAIEYGKAKVHPHGAFGAIRNVGNNAVTPDGMIYFNSDDYRKDFSQEAVWRQSWFIHEMTHVWQYQKGFPVFTAGTKLHVWDRVFKGQFPYAYWVSDDSHFNDYNFECQGRLIEDYYALIVKGDYNSMSAHGRNYLYAQTEFHDQKKRNLKRIVDEFIASSKGREQLPKEPFSMGQYVTDRNYEGR